MPKRGYFLPYFLDKFKVKAPCIRFGQAGYINPDAQFEIEDNEDHTALWSVLRKYLFRSGSATTRLVKGTTVTSWAMDSEWIGSSAEAAAKLKNHAGVEYESLGIRGNQRMGQLLGMLAKSMPDVVTKLPRSCRARGWRIVNPDEVV